MKATITQVSTVVSFLPMPPSMAILMRYGTARVLSVTTIIATRLKMARAPVRVGEAREPGELELARQVHEGAPALAALRGWRRTRAGRRRGARRWPSGGASPRPAGAGRRACPAASGSSTLDAVEVAVLLLGAAEHARVQRVAGHQLLVRAALDDAALVHHHDLVGERDGAGPVGDDEGGAPVGDLLQGAADLELRLHVDARGGVVEDEDARVHDQRPRDGDALALAAAEREAAFADDRVVALGEGLDELIGLRGLGRLAHLLVASPPGGRGGCCRRSTC